VILIRRWNVTTIQIFGATGALLLIGFLTDFLFRKTGFPDILILLTVGYIIGPIYHIVAPANLAPAAQLIASLALVVIIFNGGIGFDISKVLSSAPRAVLLVLFGVAISIAVIAAPAYFLFQWKLLDSVLLGTVVGGTSSAIVIGLVSRAKVSPNITSLLSLESVLNSPIVIVIALIVLQAISAGEAGVELATIGQTIGIRIAVGFGIGVASGLLWLWMLILMQKEEYNDVLNLAIAFLLYFVVEYLDGSGVVFALVFGLILGNGLSVGKFKLEQTEQATYMMRRFTSQVYFFVKTFFFIYLGLIITFDRPLLVAFGAVAAIVLYFGRYIAVLLSAIGSRELLSHKGLLSTMMARGESSAVLIQLVIAAKIPNADLYPNLVMSIILTTVIISAIGMLIFGRSPEKQTVEAALKNEWS
jgi:potassium/hydrogen antiporter